MTIVSVIVARWLATRPTDEAGPDLDGVLRFCFEEFGSVPSQAQAIAARRAILAVRR